MGDQGGHCGVAHLGRLPEQPGVQEWQFTGVRVRGQAPQREGGSLSAGLRPLPFLRGLLRRFGRFPARVGRSAPRQTGTHQRGRRTQLFRQCLFGPLDDPRTLVGHQTGSHLVRPHRGAVYDGGPHPVLQPLGRGGENGLGVGERIGQ